MRIDEHPLWPELLPYVFIRSHNNAKSPRFEIVNCPEDKLSTFYKMQTTCSFCEEPIHPIRQGVDSLGGRYNIYMAFSCPLKKNIRCSRTPKTSHEVTRIKNIVLNKPQDDSFGAQLEWC